MKTNMSARKILCCLLFFTFLALKSAFGQGFVNLDFENGVFVPVPGQFNTVEFAPAMPGWIGYIGTNQVNWALHNSLFLSTAGIAIIGPVQPSGQFHGNFYMVLQAGDDPFGGPERVNSAIAQTGMIPATAQSIQLLSNNPLTVGFAISFGGQPLPLQYLGQANNGRAIWGSDVSPFAGQMAELRIRGGGYFDFIEFSNQPIPEPGAFGLLALGALLLGWRFLWRSKRAA